MNTNKKLPKMYMEIKISILYSELTPLTRDATCCKLYRDGKNTTVQKFSVEVTWRDSNNLIGTTFKKTIKRHIWHILLQDSYSTISRHGCNGANLASFYEMIN